MKKITLLFTLILFGYFGFSQCPSAIKTNGQSSPSTPIFTLDNGQNGCDGSWEPTIYVNGLTYSFVDCQGGQLSYEIDGGQTPPDSFEVDVDFGGGTICQYDATGVFTGSYTLSGNKFDNFDEKVVIYPNPSIKNKDVNFKFGHNITAQLYIFDLMGKKILEKNISNSDLITLNTSKLQSGLYIARIISNEFKVNKRLIIN